MRSFQGIRSFLYRLLAVSAVLAVVGLAATPTIPAARGDAPLRLAVINFQNSANAPAASVNAMSVALYQAIATSGKFTAVGGGPLPLKLDNSGNSFEPAIEAGAKVGADEVVVGNIVQLGGGTVSYSVSIYRVTDVALVRSQIFTQNYPAPDSRTMSAAFESNVATLEAARTAEGTIYAIDNGQLDADLGTAEGFKLGQRFNVLRQGQKVADASISSISDSYAVVTISNASPGYKPAVGDRLIGLDPMPAVIPPHENSSGFSAIYALLGAGFALLAIGAHGQPAAYNPQPVSSGGTGTFTINAHSVSGNPQQQPITFVFTFSQPFDSTAFDVANNGSLAFCNVTSQGSNNLLLSFLGTSTYTPSTTSATTLTIVSEGILQANDHVTFTFTDGSTSGFTDLNGDIFTGVTFPSPFSATHKVLKGKGPAPRPVTPGVPPGKPLPLPVPVPHHT